MNLEGTLTEISFVYCELLQDQKDVRIVKY